MVTAKIALFLPTLDGGGAERVMLKLAGNFASRGYNVDLLVAKAVGAYLKQVPKSVRLVDLKASKPLTAVPALARYLKKRRPVAVMSTLRGANIALTLAMRLSGVRCRAVVRETNPTSIGIKKTHKYTSAIMPWILHWCYSYADHVVSPSQGVAYDLSRTIHYPADKIIVIHNPLDLRSIREKAYEKVSHPWLNLKTCPVIIGVGRLCEEKAFQTLIQGFARLKKKRDARLIILGEGDEGSKLKDLAGSLGIDFMVDFQGFVDNPYAYMAKADIFVLSSNTEGLSNVLIEALACEIPVISTDCPHGSKEILQNGKFGKLIPVKDPGALADAIIHILDGNICEFDLSDALAPYDEATITDRFLSLLLD